MGHQNRREPSAVRMAARLTCIITRRRRSLTLRMATLLLCSVMVLTAWWNLHGSFVLDREAAEADGTTRASLRLSSRMLAEETQPKYTELPAYEERLESRDIFWSEDWPDTQVDTRNPGEAPTTVHYLWCGNKTLRFEHYLGVLSAVHVLRPMKIVFHYTHLPLNDSYNTWFEELLKSIPILELQPLFSTTRQQRSPAAACGSKAMLRTALDFLIRSGGVYLGESVLLTRMPRDVLKQPFWFSFADVSRDPTRGIVYARHGFNDSSAAATTKGYYFREILESSRSEGRTCVSVDSFNLKRGAAAGVISHHDQTGNECVALDSNLYPRDIWDAETPFAELARWLFYGKRRPQRPQQWVEQRGSSSIPRIMHCTWFKSKKKLYISQFSFHFFLSVLSALYVGGFEHVYVHGDEEPTGKWWKKLAAEENVTFVKVDRPNTVYQQVVGETRSSHLSNVLRLIILYKYGGGYQDLDVLWTSRVPDWVLEHPVVIAPDWPDYGSWPMAFNNGVMLARRRAPFLHLWLQTFRTYYDKVLFFNSLLMPYKTYEQHPDLVYLDHYLQVICYKNICHPTWQPDYRRRVWDTRPPTQPWHWKEARSVHVTYPKPTRSLANVWALKNATDIFGEMGRYVLEKSGRLHLLPKH